MMMTIKRHLTIALALFIAFAPIAEASAQIAQDAVQGANGSAGVTSVATACGVTGGTITTTGTIQGAAQDSQVTTSTYTLTAGDCGLVKRFTGPSPVINVPAPTGFASNYFTTLKCEASSGSCSTSGTIDGSSSPITIAVGNSIDLYVDASNGWHKLPGNAAGGGGGTPGGSSGQTQYNNSGAFGGYTMSQDCTINTSTGVITCTKTNNVAFAPSATTDATNAGNIGSGTLPAGRMPAMGGDCASPVGSTSLSCGGTKTAGLQANVWALPQTGIANAGPQSTSPAANTIVCLFGVVPVRNTISTVGAAVSTLASGGNFQIALYSNVNMRPGSLIANSGNISTTAVGSPSGSLVSNAQVGPGGSAGGSDIWWCTNVDATAGGTVKMLSVVNTASTFGMGALIGSATLANLLNRLGSSLSGVQCSGAACNGGNSTFGSWPASLAGSTWTEVTSTNGPVLPGYLPASVP